MWYGRADRRGRAKWLEDPEENGARTMSSDARCMSGRSSPAQIEDTKDERPKKVSDKEKPAPAEAAE